MTSTTSTARDRRRGGMTLARAKEKLRVIGYQIRKQDGEYQVKPEGRGSWATGKLVSYATDLDDAVSTAESQIRTYLSRGEGKYRVIHQSMPISPDKATAREALATAEQFKLQVADVFWDGDAGEFRPLSSEASRDRGKRRAGERSTRSTRRARRDPDYVLMYGPRGTISLPYKLEAMAIDEARALSRPGSFGGEVAVVRREGARTVEVGRARGGKFSRDPAKRPRAVAPIDHEAIYETLRGYPRTMYRMAIHANAEGGNREVYAANPEDKRAVNALEKAGLVEVRRTKDRDAGLAVWWFRLPAKSRAKRDPASRGTSPTRRDVPRRPPGHSLYKWSLLDDAERREIAAYHGGAAFGGRTRRQDLIERAERAEGEAASHESDARTSKVHAGWGTIGTPRHAWGAAEKAHRRAAELYREAGDDAAARRHEVAATEAREQKQRTPVTQLEGFHRGRKSSARMRDRSSRARRAGRRDPGRKVEVYVSRSQNLAALLDNVYGHLTSTQAKALMRVIDDAERDGEDPRRAAIGHLRQNGIIVHQTDGRDRGRRSASPARGAKGRASTRDPDRFGQTSISADNLVLHADNSRALYDERTRIVKGLASAAKRHREGYVPARALVVWRRYVDDVAKHYAREFGGTWNQLFSTATRQEAANDLEQREARKMHAGEYAHLGVAATRDRAKRDPLPHGRSSKASPVRVERGGASQVAWHGKSPNFAPVTVVWNGPGSRLFLLWGKSMVPVQHPSANASYDDFKSADRAARAFIGGGR